MAIRARYVAVVDKLTALTFPDNSLYREYNGIKRLALEVIYAACNDARSDSKNAEGRKIRADALLFLNGQSPLQIKTRNAWLRAAGIEVDYYNRSFDTKNVNRRAGQWIKYIK